MYKPGDRIAVVDEDLEGRIIAVDEDEVKIETDEGFILIFNKEEIVKIEVDLPEILPDDTRELSEVIREKQGSLHKRKVPVRSSKKERSAPPMEVDLHIHNLVSKTRGLGNFEMLNLQVETAQRQLDFAIKKRLQRVVFIHGVGEGVLRAELETLFNRYDNIKYYDASYEKYGLGATEVYIFQNY